ncbi:USP2 [Acanthosepion pharaonis]|uniref:Ubiquitin carboxyl-terminal hydrolase n=1 Tax=Acanthosepion pharaonis TaxID=158019 RepID=A0A812CZU3_ACAPH|nr:USP2 [Sepia pharaonis]
MQRGTVASRRASLELLTAGSSSSSPSYLKNYRSDSFSSKYGLSNITSTNSVRLTNNVYSRRLPDGPGPLDRKGKPFSSDFRSSRLSRFGDNTPSSLLSYTKPLKSTDYNPTNGYTSNYLCSGYSSTLSRSYRSPVTSSSLYSGGTIRSSRASSELPSSDRRYSDTESYGSSHLRAASQSRSIDVEPNLTRVRTRAPSVDVAYERLTNRTPNIEVGYEPLSSRAPSVEIEQQSYRKSSIDHTYDRSSSRAPSIEHLSSRAPSIERTSTSRAPSLERQSSRGARKDIETAAENYNSSSSTSSSSLGWRARVYRDRQSPVTPLTDQTNHINNAATRRPVIKIDDQNGMVGLQNLGNTCFMNSIVQCMNKSPPLLDYILSDKYKLDIAKPGAARCNGSLLRAFSEIMKQLWTSRMEITPTVFRNSIKKLNSMYQGSGQEDAHEFFNHLINGLHEELDTTKKREPLGVDITSWYNFCKGDTKITDVFALQMKHSYTCLTCNTHFKEYHTSFDLSMPMKKAIRVVDMEEIIRDFMECTSNNMCKKCGKLMMHDCNKKFVHLPEVLVLYFQRAEKLGKLKTEMRYPVECLDLTPFVNKSLSGSTQYRLFAVCCHAGDCATMGHYWAECRHSETAEWNKYNDTRVTSISKGNTATGSRECVFFYQRK